VSWADVPGRDPGPHPQPHPLLAAAIEVGSGRGQLASFVGGIRSGLMMDKAANFGEKCD